MTKVKAYIKSKLHELAVNFPNNTLFFRTGKKPRFFKKVETKDGSENQKILDGIKQAVEEVKLVKAGKLKLRPLKELLDEI